MAHALIFQILVPHWPHSFLSIICIFLDLIVCEVEREIHLNGLATLQWSWRLSKNESGLVEQQLESALIFFQAAWWKLALLNNHISKPFLRPTAHVTDAVTVMQTNFWVTYAFMFLFILLLLLLAFCCFSIVYSSLVGQYNLYFIYIIWVSSGCKISKHWYLLINN